MVASFSSIPTSSEITVPPVRIAMSLEHILAAIAKARSLNSYAGEGAAQTC